MHRTKCACVKYHVTKIVSPLRNRQIRLNFNFHMFSAGAGVFSPGAGVCTAVRETDGHGRATNQ